MKKKIVSLSLVLMILISLIPNNAMAQQNIKIIVDGKEVKTDVAPYIENGRTMVPIRFVAEAFGKTVDYYPEKDVFFNLPSVYIDNPDGLSVTLYIGSSIASIEQNAYNTGSNAVIKNGRTFVPLRFIADVLAFDTQWDEKTSTINITSLSLEDKLFKLATDSVENYYDEEKSDIISRVLSGY